MGLTNLLKRNKQTQSEPYYALEISHELVKAALWTVEEGKVSIINTGEIIDVEKDDLKSLLYSTDMALATANDELDQEPDKIIFGLPEHWVDESGIVSAKKSTLKHLCQKLELKPLGYVVTLEALITYLKNQQGTPPSAIFVRVSPQELLISLVTLGKIQYRQSVARTDDIVTDVHSALKHFKDAEQFPARIILYNGHTDFEDIKQQLIANHWEKDFPFLHTPKIESLSAETSVEAVAIAGGKEVAISLGIDMEPDEETIKSSVSTSQTDKIVDEVSSEKPNSTSSKTSPKIPQDEIPEGFVIGEDISVQKEENIDSSTQNEETKLSDEQEKEPKNPKPKFSLANVSIFAKFNPFTKEKKDDNSESHQKGQQTLDNLESTTHPPSSPELAKEEPKTEVKTEPKKESKKESKKDELVIPEIPKEDLPKEKPKKSIKPKKTTKKLPKLKVPGSKIRIWAVILAVLLLLAGGVAAAWYYYYNIPKAEVTLYLYPKVIDKEVTFTASNQASSLDQENLIIPARIKEITVSGSESAPATGTKRIGETAEGSVTIYNKTDDSKNFDKGTVLIGPSNLRFVTLESATIASQSATETDDGASITFGKTDVKIEAGSIGEEYNIGNSGEFTIKGFGSDNFSAKVSSSISGGNSSTIQIVSEEDQALALTNLTKTLSQQAKDQIKAQTGGTSIAIGDEFESEVSEETYSQEVGDEATSVMVTAQLALSAITVDKKDYDYMLMQAISQNVPQNYAVTDNGLQSEITETNTNEDKTEITVKVKAQLLPRLEFAQIKQNIKGKYPPIVEDYFKSLPEFNKVIITINPALPGKLGTLPQKEENITIKVEQTK